MKKAFIATLVAAMFGATAMASDADMLIWQIDLQDSPYYENVDPLPSFNKINLWLQSGDNIIRLESKTYDTANDVYGLSAITTGIDPEGYTTVYATDLTGLSNDDYGRYELMMQFWNNDDLVSFSDNLFDSSKHIYLRDLARTTMPSDTNPISIDSSLAIQLGARVVPEPTSGLLMMLGAGLLALRRRRRA